MYAKNISKVGSTLKTSSETLVGDAAKGKVPAVTACGLQVKTNLKAGMGLHNHNETLVRDAAKGKVQAGSASGLRVKTNLKAGGGLLYTTLRTASVTPSIIGITTRPSSATPPSKPEEVLPTFFGRKPLMIADGFPICDHQRLSWQGSFRVHVFQPSKRITTTRKTKNRKRNTNDA